MKDELDQRRYIVHSKQFSNKSQDKIDVEFKQWKRRSIIAPVLMLNGVAFAAIALWNAVRLHGGTSDPTFNMWASITTGVLSCILLAVGSYVGSRLLIDAEQRRGEHRSYAEFLEDRDLSDLL